MRAIATPSLIDLPVVTNRPASAHYSVQITKQAPPKAASNDTSVQVQVTGTVIMPNPSAAPFQITTLQVMGQPVKGNGGPVGDAVAADAPCSQSLGASQGGLACPFTASFTLPSPQAAVSIKMTPITNNAVSGAVLVGQAMDLSLSSIQQDQSRDCVLVTSEFRAYSDKVGLMLRKGVPPAYSTKAAAPVCSSASYNFTVSFAPSKAWKCSMAERTQKVINVFRLSDATTQSAFGPQATLELLLIRSGCEAADLDLLTKLMDSAAIGSSSSSRGASSSSSPSAVAAANAQARASSSRQRSP